MLRRLDRNASAVERDALSHQPQKPAALLAAAVTQHDHLGRLVRPFGHRQEGAHLQPARVRQLEDTQLEPRAADGFAHFGSEDRGRKSIGRQVDPLPDLVGDLGQGDGLVDGRGGGTPAV